ncbi:unnamed protein product, partial [Discosporangium mesarthrocarpum]
GKDKGKDPFPAFAKTNKNQLWPCIVEKAFAKLHGSYGAISGGHICDAFEALTGAPTETVFLDSPDSEGSWAKLVSFSDAGFPMGCATAWDPTRTARDAGLVGCHAYSILEVRELHGVRGARQPTLLDFVGPTAREGVGRRAGGGQCEVIDGTNGQPLRLLRIRNPWGRKEWTGDWSRTSEVWTERTLSDLGGRGRPGDGTFWMGWQDFISRFQVVDVCKARRGWSHSSLSNHTLHHQKQECRKALEVRAPPGKGSAWVYLSVVQPDKRGRLDSYWYKPLSVFVTERGDSEVSEVPGNLNAMCIGGTRRMICCELFLEVGKVYTVSVMCLGRVVDAHAFWMTLYSPRPLEVTELDGEEVALGPIVHQAMSQLWLEDKGTKVFPLAVGAALVVTEEGGVAFVMVVNTRPPMQPVQLRLTLAPVEGATVSSAASPGGVFCCPGKSQRVIITLARTADHGSFEYVFHYDAPGGVTDFGGTVLPGRVEGMQKLVASDLRFVDLTDPESERVAEQNVPGSVDTFGSDQQMMRSTGEKDCGSVTNEGRQGGERGCKAQGRGTGAVESKAEAEHDHSTRTREREQQNGYTGRCMGGIFSAQPVMPGAERLVRKAEALMDSLDFR